tara:strand:+ start:2343 stop:3362 length:1020 start_codon:yes stop_codon:yes gene_type:complete
MSTFKGTTLPYNRLVPLISFQWDEQFETYQQHPFNLPNQIKAVPVDAQQVQFTNNVYYARHDDVVNTGVNWQPIPEMEIDMGTALHGGVESNPVKIKLPSDINPIKYMIGRKFAPVTVTIYEHVIDGTSNLRQVFKGKVTTVTARKSGHSLITEIEIHGVKRLFEQVPSGIRLTQLCGWIYGDCNCNAADKNDRFLAKINSIDQTTLGLNPVLLPSTDPGKDLFLKYYRGYVTKVIAWQPEQEGVMPLLVSGHRITTVGAFGAGSLILADPPKQYASGDTDDPGFDVEPFAYRVGDYVIIGPGCGKTPNECLYGHNNEGNYGGFGTYIPKYNPMIETIS